MHKTFLYSLCLAGFILTGCSTLNPTDQPSPAPDEPSESDEPRASATPGPVIEEVPERPFEPSILYGLLAAELAAERGRLDVTLINYVEAAKRTKDPGVIRRALQLAQGLGADNAQHQVSQAWLEVDPDNLAALRVAAVQAIKKNNVERTVEYLERIYDQDEEARFDNLGNYAATLEPEQQEQLISLFEQLQSAFPESGEVGFNLAILRYTADRTDQAIDALEPLLDRNPGYQPAIALYSTLLFESGEQDQAITYLGDRAREFPESRKLGTLHARMLVDASRLGEAQEEFQRLLKQDPDNPGLRLSYALVALENNSTRLARKQLEQLLEHGRYRSEAHYYLGRVAEAEGEEDRALEHYREVERGSQLFAALARSGEILAQRGEIEKALARLEQAREALPNQTVQLWMTEIDLLRDNGRLQQALESANQALAQHPEEVSLRYNRAMLYEQQDQLEAAEADLRWIIEREPENAIALNALGYTLTVKTNRYDEAMELISKALELAPDNPAIIDSLGWLHFKQGNPEKALDYIQSAYQRFPDPEVAAHLGEILWSLNRPDDARQVWGQALEAHPDSGVLNDTLDRLDVELEAD